MKRHNATEGEFDISKMPLPRGNKMLNTEWRDWIDFGAMIAIVIMLATVISLMAAPVMVDVEIYRMEDGSYIYCATGSLTDPPATHISSGQVKKGQESYC